MVNMSKKQEVTNMNESAWWAWAIKNSICVICWIILAIIFNKWWIALFAGLFLSSLETYRKYYRVCDFCGKHSPHVDSRNEAIKVAKKLGWSHYEEENLDYCPECREEFDNKLGQAIRERFDAECKL